jgi:hypothetical protein
MRFATTICGRSSEGRASLRRSVRPLVTRGLANSVNGQGSTHRSDLTSARPSTPQTAPAGTTRPASSLLIAAAVVFMSQKRASICDSHSRSGSLSGLKTAAQFASVFLPTEPSTTTNGRGEVREGNRNGFPYSGIHAGLQQSTLQADLRSGRNLFAHVRCDRSNQSRDTLPAGMGNPFPVERDLTTPRILRLTNPVTSPAENRRVVADGETIGAVDGHQQSTQPATERN